MPVPENAVHKGILDGQGNRTSGDGVLACPGQARMLLYLELRHFVPEDAVASAQLTERPFLHPLRHER